MLVCSFTSTFNIMLTWIYESHFFCERLTRSGPFELLGFGLVKVESNMSLVCLSVCTRVWKGWWLELFIDCYVSLMDLPRFRWWVQSLPLVYEGRRYVIFYGYWWAVASFRKSLTFGRKQFLWCPYLFVPLVKVMNLLSQLPILNPLC